jgi:predicted DNA-binding protein
VNLPVRGGNFRLCGVLRCDTLQDMRSDVQRSFRLSAELDEKLVKEAERLDRSASWVILRALEVALEGQDKAIARALTRGAARR